LAHPEAIPTEEADLLRPIPAPEGDTEGARGMLGLPERPGPGAEPAPKKVLPGVLLGEELFAHTLRGYMGSDVDIACPMCGIGPIGPMPKLKSFRVAGHFYTGMYVFDSKLAYVSLAEAQKLLGVQGEVTGIEVHTRTPEIARDVADEIARRLGKGYEVR